MHAMMERRLEPRRASAERATAHTDEGGGLACVITDVSATGARLGFAAPVDLPKRFEITGAPTGTSRIVHLVWQRGLEAGVTFNAPPTFRERLKHRSWFGG